jgi:hypothetical protein
MGHSCKRTIFTIRGTHNVYEIMPGFVVKWLWRLIETPPILRIDMHLKKIASPSEALPNGADKTLATLK